MADWIEELKRLASLREQGILSDEEFEAAKKKILEDRNSETPAEVRHAGPSKGKHNKEIFCGELKLKLEELERLQKEGVV